MHPSVLSAALVLACAARVPAAQMGWICLDGSNQHADVAISLDILPALAAHTFEERILFCVQFPGEADRNIWSVRPDGSSLRRLYDRPGNQWGVDLSPDGMSVAFFDGDGTALQPPMGILRRNRDGSHQRQFVDRDCLTMIGSTANSPVSYYFQAVGRSDPSSVKRHNPVSGLRMLLPADNVRRFSGAVSPDGELLAYCRTPTQFWFLFDHGEGPVADPADPVADVHMVTPRTLTARVRSTSTAPDRG